MILYGKPLAQNIINELKVKDVPSGKFVVIQVGEDQTSSLYVEKKRELASEIGINFEVLKLNQNINFETFRVKIGELNKDQSVRAILIQIPLPGHINRERVAKMIDPKKDIDGFHYILGQDQGLIPPTVMAIVDLLKFYKINLDGKKILIIGGGFLVGRPLYRFYNEDARDVEILSKDDADYQNKIKSADIVISATGGGKIFSFKDFQDGAVVIDASTIAEGGATKGDVNLEAWPESISIAPVPGGVGPVTVAELMKSFYLL